MMEFENQPDHELNFTSLENVSGTDETAKTLAYSQTMCYDSFKF